MSTHLDFETRSDVDLKKVGAWAYAMHPSTEIICMSYCPDGETTPRLLTWTDVQAPRTTVFIAPPMRVVAHSAHFEYAIYNYILHKRFGWPERWDPKLWDCTLARAAMCNLPQSLNNLGAALGLVNKKDLDGRAAMLKLCKPIGRDPLDNSPIYNEDPELYKKTYAYCADDVRAEMEIDKRLPQLPAMERAVFELDLVMNHRGVLMDVPLAKVAASFADKLTANLNTLLNRLTGGAVDKATRVASLKTWLESQGIEGVTSLDKESLNGLLAREDVPARVKDVLNIRRQVGKTSTAKYEAILAVASPIDNRARGLIQYHGASTGRFAGRLLQPHNFPKGVKEAAQKEIVDAVMDGDAEWFALMYGDRSMDALSHALRGTIIAPKGKLIAAVDYNAIEPRVLFWLADDASALAAYRAGGSPYLEMGEFIYKRKITKKDETEYAVSKFTVLGAGYGMGPVRFKAQCAAAGLKISDELAVNAVGAYRAKYKTVTSMWYAMEGAAKKAIKEPGTAIKCCGGRIVWGMDPKREFLVCKLPSGRHLRYYRPRMHAYIHPEYGEREEIRYWSPGLGGVLEEQKTYGGSLVENVVQAVARDLLVQGMLNVEAAGYDNVLNVHDEIVCEIGPERITGSDKLMVEHVIKLMCETPKWAAGCPVAAEGFVSNRYRK